MNTQTQKFQKVKKKYALTNSYFKNASYSAPRTPVEVFEYFLEHGELPYENGTITSYWFYDCIVEFQKRNGVFNSQFFTPPKTAERIADVAKSFFNNTQPYILDACCGFGMLSIALAKKGYTVNGIDFSWDFENVYEHLTGGKYNQTDFKDFKPEKQFSSIVSNPPYEVKECSEFLDCLYNWLSDLGIAVLLLPKGFIDKDKPKALAQTLSKFKILHREDMQEPFARTAIRAEIVVLEAYPF